VAKAIAVVEAPLLFLVGIANLSERGRAADSAGVARARCSLRAGLDARAAAAADGRSLKL
jgi:hypothetical protein